MSVVIEQTFYKAMRRIDFVEDIQKLGVPAAVYVMMPSEEQLRRNAEKRAQHTGDNPRYIFERVSNMLFLDFEFPNPAEGFSRIYEVTDTGIKERHDEPDWDLVEKAKEKLKQDRRERPERLEAERQYEEFRLRLHNLHHEEPAVIESGAPARERYGEAYGGQIEYLSSDQLDALNNGKQLAIPIAGGEYVLFLNGPPGDEKGVHDEGAIQ